MAKQLYSLNCLCTFAMAAITAVCCPPLAGCRRPAHLLFRRFRRKAQCRWWDENYFMDADGKEWYWSPDRATWIDKDGYDDDGYYEDGYDDGSYRWDGYDDGYDEFTDPNCVNRLPDI